MGLVLISACYIALAHHQSPGCVEEAISISKKGVIYKKKRAI